MSYRELRDITEILRTLGFPRLVSIENFRCPNFALMAEVLEWVVVKFDPNVRISKCIDSETDRVIYVKTCVMTLIQKAHVLLNPKNLYQSDGMAVRELLVVLRMLYDARQQRGISARADDAARQTSAIRSMANTVRQEVRRSTQLAAQMPHAAANIYDLLRKEVSAKEERSRALSQPLNVREVERELNEMIAQTEKRTADVRFKLANISTDEQDLEHKIERRKREYDQLQKRLVKLQTFRPPYMDEYERYEAQLKDLYALYVVLFRNLSHLQQQLWEVERAERDRMLSAEHNMRLAVDKMRLENDITAVPSIIGEVDMDDENEFSRSKEVKVVGNMLGAGLSDDDDDEDDDDITYGDDDDDDIGGNVRLSTSSKHDTKTDMSLLGGDERLERASLESGGGSGAQARGLEAIMENDDEDDEAELRDSDDDF